MTYTSDCVWWLFDSDSTAYQSMKGGWGILFFKYTQVHVFDKERRTNGCGDVCVLRAM